MQAPVRTSLSPAVSVRALFAFALGCTFFGYAFMQRVAPSVIVDELMRDFMVGGAILGNLSAFYFYAYAGFQIPVGIMMDRFGPRRLLSLSLLLCVLGSFLFATADGAVPAAIARAIIGASVAFGYVGTMTIAAQQFSPARFALCVGILQAVGMAGAVAGQAPFRLLVDAFDWREAVMWMGGGALVLAIAIWFTVRDGARHVSQDGRLLDGIRYALRSRETWLNALIGMSLTAPMLALPGLWAVPYLTSVYEMDRTAAAGLASMLFIGWGVTAPLAGFFSDLIGRRKPIVIGGVAITIIMLSVISFVPDIPIPYLYVAFVVMGMGGGVMILNFALCRETTPLWARGAALGVVNGSVTASGALFQPLLGWILDRNWDGTLVDGARIYDAQAYTLAFTALLATLALGFVAAVSLKETFGRQLVE